MLGILPLLLQFMSQRPDERDKNLDQRWKPWKREDEVMPWVGRRHEDLYKFRPKSYNGLEGKPIPPLVDTLEFIQGFKYPQDPRSRYPMEFKKDQYYENKWKYLEDGVQG